MADPFRRINSSSPSPIFRRSNTLQREGRQPQDKTSILRRRVTRKPSLHPTRLQNNSAIGIDQLFRHVGNGNGSLSSAGKHFHIQSESNLFVCLSNAKRPRSEQDLNHYDLELSLKCGKPATQVAFVFGYDNRKFFMVTGDCSKQARTWTLTQFLIDVENCRLSKNILDTTKMEKNIKPHLFCKIFLQVRGAEVSLDINEVPVFTSLTMPGGCVGEVGVAAAHNTSMVFKEFQIKRNMMVQAGGKGKGKGEVTYDGGAPPPPHSATTMATTRSLLPPPSFNLGDPVLVEQIERDMVKSTDQKIQFRDIAGHEDAKRLLNEAVVMPMLVPELFSGIREPWRGVLLFGPPGTGKTMLARATAAVAGINFFNTSAASLVSKYRGESEKLVKTLFQVARHWSPSVIFIDEIDALVKSRGSDNEHEASRRLKSEFLTQMDGITSHNREKENIVVLATTNCPWDLDQALLRRLEKRIHVNIPNEKTRTELFQLLLSGNDIQVDTKKFALYPLVKRTANYSGADIRMLVREAAMGPMRRILNGKNVEDIAHMRLNGMLTSEHMVIQLEDFISALKKTSSSVDVNKIGRYNDWAASYGSQ